MAEVRRFCCICYTQPTSSRAAGARGRFRLSSRRHGRALPARPLRDSLSVSVWAVARLWPAPRPHHDKVTSVASAVAGKPASRGESKTVKAHGRQHPPTCGARDTGTCQQEHAQPPAVPQPARTRRHVHVVAAERAGLRRPNLACAAAARAPAARARGCAGPQTPGPGGCVRRASRAVRSHSACPRAAAAAA